MIHEGRRQTGPGLYFCLAIPSLIPPPIPEATARVPVVRAAHISRPCRYVCVHGTECMNVREGETLGRGVDDDDHHDHDRRSHHGDYARESHDI